MGRNQLLFLSITAALTIHFLIVVHGYPETLSSGAYGSEIQFPFEISGHMDKRFPNHLNPTNMKFWVQLGDCGESTDGAKKYFCPSVTPNGKFVCIDDYQLCNGVKECPQAEDENRNYCFFYKALQSQVQVLERSVSTLNAEVNFNSPVRRYSQSFGRTVHDN